MTAGRLTLVLGGIRSGKSAFAEELVRGMGLPTIYLATGQATDDEMEARIQSHRQRRPAEWATVEEPLELVKALEPTLAGTSGRTAVMVDAMDTWVGNLLFRHEESPAEELTALTTNKTDQLLELLERSPAEVVMVSSEVGHSLVSPNELGRRFQDLLGSVNQRLAAAANDVYLVVAGIPLQVKPPGYKQSGE